MANSIYSKLVKIILVVAILIAMQGCSVINDVSRVFVSSIPFDEKVWKDINRRDDRPGMARDLVSRKALIGKTRDEVRAMLGHEKSKASTESYARYEIDIFEEIQGDLHPTRAEYLKLNFGADGRVASSEIQMDRYISY